MSTLGRETVIGVGEESTWGTAVSRTVWAEVVSANIQRRRSHTPRPVLGYPGSTPTRQGHAPTQEEVSGSVELIATYRSIGIFLKHLLGSVSSSGSGPYVHTYTLSGAGQTGLTIEQLLGTGSNSELFEGCKITRGSLRMNSGDFMRLSLEILGQTGSRSSKGSPSFPANLAPVLAHHFASLSWNSSTAYNLRSLTVNIDRKLSRRPVLGSLLTLEPVPSDFFEITVQAEIEYNNSDGLWTAHHGDTSGDLVITINGDSPNAMVITGQNALITTLDTPRSSPDIIVQSVTWTIRGDSSDPGLTIAITNADSSAVAA